MLFWDDWLGQQITGKQVESSGARDSNVRKLRIRQNRIRVDRPHSERSHTDVLCRSRNTSNSLLEYHKRALWRCLESSPPNQSKNLLLLPHLDPFRLIVPLPLLWLPALEARANHRTFLLLNV